MSTELLTAGSLAIDAQQIQDSKTVLKKAGDFRQLSASLADEAGTQIPLPASLNRLIETVLRTAAAGGSVTFTAMPSVLSSSAAAHMLGISRPTLMKFAREGQIDATFVGTHARFTIEAVRAFAAKRHSERSDAFNGLRDLTAEMHLG